MQRVSLNVNGTPVSREVEDETLLAVFLREYLGLTGTHVGCDTTQCGCCVVQLDGTSVKSCTVLASQADGGRVTTIEGLAKDGVLHPVQEAFRRCHALQCGFCTPGMIMAAVDLIASHAEPRTGAIVREEMEGTFCPGPAYHNIVKPVRSAPKFINAGATRPADMAAE